MIQEIRPSTKIFVNKIGYGEFDCLKVRRKGLRKGKVKITDSRDNG